MIRAAIVDDEKKSRSTLKTLLTRYCDGINVIAEAETVSDGQKMLDTSNPELLFLDIAMPDGKGFELLRSNHSDMEVIFITAHDEYAIQAIKNNATDYLLKPLNIAELQKAVLKATKRIYEKKAIQALSVRHYDQPVGWQQHLVIPIADGLKFINLHHIIHLTAKGSYTQISCKDKITLLSSKPLKEYEQMLPAAQFFRIHHSNIINLAYIKQYYRGNGGHVVMEDGSSIDISKRRKKDFLNLFYTSQ